MKLPETIQNSLVCPICHSKISDDNTSLSCVVCQKKFPVVDGIPDMYVPTMQEAADNISQSNQDFFDKTSDAYQDDYIKMNPILKKILKGIISKDTFDERTQQRTSEIFSRYLNGNSLLLDVGTGTGQLLSIGKNFTNQLVGLDISYGMLKIASKSKLPVMRANNYCLPFASDTFDMISALAVVHHMADLKLFLREMARVLKNGGILFTDADPNPIALSIKSGSKRYVKISKFLKSLLRKNYLDLYQQNKIDRSKVEFHYANDTPSNEYNIENLNKFGLNEFGHEPRFYFHSNATSATNNDKIKGETLLNKIRKFVLHKFKPQIPVFKCSEYMMIIFSKPQYHEPKEGLICE